MAERRRPDPRQKYTPEAYRFQGFIPSHLHGDEEQVRAIIMDRAQAAQELLQSRAFQLVVHEIRTATAFEIFSSMPGQEEQREDAYFRARGLDEIVMRLQGMVNERDTLVRREQESARGAL